MNWREGFARIGRLTAICYAVLSAIIIATVFASSRTVPVGTSYEITARSGHLYHVRAMSLEEAFAAERLADAQAHDTASFTYPEYLPSRLDGQTTTSFSAGKDAAGGALLWLALIYVAFWALFRGVRWIFAGFVTP